MENQPNKRNPIKSFIAKWKKIDKEQKTLMVIIIFVVAFISLMPTLYKSWVNFRDHGFRFGSSDKQNQAKDPNAGKTLTMTCTQVVENEEYKTEIKTLIYYVDNELKKEDYSMSMTAINDIAKEELPIRKSIFEETETAYQALKGFKVKSNVTENVFSYNLITDYAAIDEEELEKAENSELNSVIVNLKYNQQIDSVQSYYEDLGFECKK